jgi:hypothetical protein
MIWVVDNGLAGTELLWAGVWEKHTPDKITRAAATAVIFMLTKTFAEYTLAPQVVIWATKKVSSCIYTRIQISKKAARNVLNTAPKSV